MALESFLTRWRKAVRAPGTPAAALLAQRRRQRRLIYRTLSVIVLLGAAWFIYGYWASAPDRAREEVALGEKKMGLGAYDESIGHFDRAVEVWPEYAEAYLSRAVAEHNASRPGAALADLAKALDLDPISTRAHNVRGQIYLENGDAQKAILEFSKSLQVQPTLDGYYQRGEAYEKQGEHQKAIADFDAALVEFREAPYAYRARAVAKRNMGDREGASADEETARRIETGRSVEPDVLLAP
jgi:tetratricopeptide (TPR) repeat protein